MELTSPRGRPVLVAHPILAFAILQAPSLRSAILAMRERFNDLNVIIRISRPTGWRTEWDMSIKDGVVREVQLSLFDTRGQLNQHATVPADVFFATVEKEIGLHL